MSAQPNNAVFIAFQANEESRGIVEAIGQDNPAASVQHFPAMVKIEAPQRLVIRRSTVEEHMGRAFDLRELHINLISLSGSIEESDEEFVLHWGAR